MNNKTLNKLKPFIYGKLLGDATLENTRKATHNSRMKIKQKLDHEEYVRQCYQKIHNFSTKVYIDKSARTYKGITKHHKAWCFKTKAMPVWTNLRKDWYREDGVKGLPSDLKDHFNWETVAYWYMDDGSLNHSTKNYYEMFFYTNNFLDYEVDQLVDLLRGLGVKSAYKRQDRCRKDGTPCYIIRVGDMEDEKLICENIKAHVPSCLHYKIRIP